MHQQRGDRVREGDSRRWLSRLAWFAADRVTAVREGHRAVELLEAEPPGRELAMAYSNASQLAMLAGDLREALECGELAIELAERLGETEILVHALNNVGAAGVSGGMPGATAELERSLALALEYGYDEHAARAYTNLASGEVWAREYASADRRLTIGIGVLRRARPRSLALVHDGLGGSDALRAGPVERGRRDRDGGTARADSPRGEPDHAAGGPRAVARAPG